VVAVLAKAKAWVGARTNMQIETDSTSVRQTSINAYHKIKNEGLLSQKRMEAYEGLVFFGPGTAMEILTNMRTIGLGSKIIDSQIRARFFELREMGVAKELGEKICNITKMTVIEWQVVDAIPIKLKKEEKKYWVLFVQQAGKKVRIYKNKEKAIAWKFKHGISGVLHEAIFDNS